MSDPVRYKGLEELHIEAKPKAGGDPVDFYVLVDPTKVTKMVEDEVKHQFKKDLDQISLTAVSGINKTHLAFSYEDKDVLKDFDFGNVLVEAHLPYVLHIPNHYEMEISLPELGLNAQVIFHKIWTNRAHDDKGTSDEIDLFAENQSLYFRNSNIITPRVPFDSREGWDSPFTGRNIEGIGDRNGVFRYTKVYIQFNLDIPDKTKVSEEQIHQVLLGKAQEVSLSVINKVIEVYRDVAGTGYIRKLGRLKINLVYFIPLDIGYYILEPNMETARMNRSRQEITKIKYMLARGNRPELYKLLLLNARDSFETKDYTLAIVESFQALEIFVENYLVREFVARGDKEEQYTQILETRWRTKDRLNDVLKDIKGVSLNQQTIWEKWHNKYDQTRSEVIHKGKEATRSETEETLSVNEKVIEWLLTL